MVLYCTVIVFQLRLLQIVSSFCYVFSGPQPRWTTSITVNAPTFPVQYLPGGVPRPPHVRVVQQTFYQEIPQQNVPSYRYVDPFAEPTVIYEQNPCAYPHGGPAGYGPQTGVMVTTAHPYPVTCHSHYTAPMPQVGWSHRPQPVRISARQKVSSFEVSGELTGDQKNYLMTAQPTGRQRPISSLPELETPTARPPVTQSQRYVR